MQKSRQNEIHLKCGNCLIFDPFFGDFCRAKHGGRSEFHEAVTNLFLELKTSNLINLGNLGVKLKEIESKSLRLCQFNQFFNEEVKYQRIFLSFGELI